MPVEDKPRAAAGRKLKRPPN